MVSLRALVGIAGVGGMITSLTGYTLHWILQKRVTDSPVYKKTMKLINNHAGITQLMGKPIQSGDVDTGNPNNILSLTRATLELPVYGPKTKGTVYLWADRLSPEEKWEIKKMELEILDEFGGRVSIVNKETTADR